MPYGLARPIAWVLFQLLYRFYGGFRFEGRENVPRRGGVLIASNHISDSDPPLLCLALPRDCYIMAKEELFSMRVLGTLIRWLHGFPVKRYTPDRPALRFAEEKLKEGAAVIIFPEGKLSEDGKLQPLLPGVLLIAKSADAPIVPTILIGTDDLMPYGKLTPRRTRQRMVVRFARPTTITELTGGVKGGEALKRGAERLHAIMLALQSGQPDPRDLPPPAHPTVEIEALKESDAPQTNVSEPSAPPSLVESA